MALLMRKTSLYSSSLGPGSNTLIRTFCNSYFGKSPSGASFQPARPVGFQPAEFQEYQSNTMIPFETDFLIFTPHDVDLSRSPLRATLQEETFVLGAFNPGLTRLPGGNLLMMVRVAEALRQPVWDNHIHALRWNATKGFVTDAYDLAKVDATDPRKFQILGHQSKVMALTSISWLLPVELSPDGFNVVAIHYDKAIIPQAEYQQYGVEDARISRVGDLWLMTTCSVSAERHSTTLYESTDGLNYQLKGIVLDHQN